MSFPIDWNKILSGFSNRWLNPELTIIEIVFLNRNKDYGAYVLRKDYNRNLSFTMWSVVLLFAILSVINLINTISSGIDSEEYKPPKVVQVSQLSEPPSIVETSRQRIHTPVSQKKFVQPKVLKDEKVVREAEFTHPDPGVLNSNPDEVLTLKEEKKVEPPPVPKVPETYFVAVDFMPEPIDNIQSKIVYPEEAKQESIQGRVIVKAFINENGTVTRTEIVKGIGYGCDEAAERAVLRTRFRPGKQKGMFVKVQMSIQVVFKL